MPDLHSYLSGFYDLIAWLIRSYVEFGNVKVLDADWSAYAYLFALLPLPFAAARQFRAGRWPLGLVLSVLTLYFIHNRLGLFSTVQVTRASLVGNLALLALGVLFSLPIEIWAGQTQKGSHGNRWQKH